MTKGTRRLVNGAIILSISGIIVKFVSIFFKVPLANLTGLEGMGYYQTVYSMYLFLTAAALIGIPNSVSKLIAEERANGDYKMAHETFRTGFIITTLFGTLISALFILLTPSLIQLFKWESETRYAMYGLSLAPVFISMSGAFRGYFQGVQWMVPTAVSQVLENMVKVLVGISLVYYLLTAGYSIPQAIGGATLGITTGFVLSTGYLLVQYQKRKASLKAQIRDNQARLGFVRTSKKVLAIAIPVTISSAALSFMNMVDSLTMYHIFDYYQWSSQAANEVLGQIGTVQTIINVPLVLSVSLAISIVPAVASAKAQGDLSELRRKILEALQLGTKFALPSMVGIVLLAEPILSLVYPGTDLDPAYLKIYGLGLVFMIAAQTLTSVLQGLSRYYVALVTILSSALIKVLLNLVLVNPVLGGKGAVMASIGYYGIMMIMNYYMINKAYTLPLPWMQTLVKPVLASLAMGGSLYLLKNHLSILPLVGIGVMVYSILLVGMKGLTEEEVLVFPKGEKVRDILQKYGLLK